LLINTVALFYFLLALTCSSEYFKSTIMRVLFMVISRTVITIELKQLMATFVMIVTAEVSIYITMRSQSELFLLQRSTENAEKQM